MTHASDADTCKFIHHLYVNARYSDRYSYWVDMSVADQAKRIRPVGWCARNGVELEPPPDVDLPFSWGQYLECTSSRAVPERALVRAPWTPPGANKADVSQVLAPSASSAGVLTPPLSAPDRTTRHRKRVATESPPPRRHKAMMALQRATGTAADGLFESMVAMRPICQVREFSPCCIAYSSHTKLFAAFSNQYQQSLHTHIAV